MKTEASDEQSFYREVVLSGNVWTIQIDNRVPTFDDENGKSAFFVWSSRDRVMGTIENEYLFQGCGPLGIPWMLFSAKLLPDLAEQQMVFILNWFGQNNPVWEESAEEIATNMKHQIELHQKTR